MTTLYRAFHDFIEIQKGEIILMKNDVILFIKQVDYDWFHGLNISSGEKGLMPRTFVEPCLLPKIKYRDENFMDNLYLTISPYDSSHSEDLKFDSNEIIFVVKNEDENWMYGINCSEKEGLFPKNFVKKIFMAISDKENVAVSINDFSTDIDSSKFTAPPQENKEKNIIPQNKKIIEEAPSKIDFFQKKFVSKGIALIDLKEEEIKNSDTIQELVMKENDVIEIYEFLENGWGLCKNSNTQKVGKVNLEFIFISEGYDPINQSENKRKFDWWKKPEAELLLAPKPHETNDSAPQFEDQTAPLSFPDDDLWQNNDLMDFYNYSDDKNLEKQFDINSSISPLDNYIADGLHAGNMMDTHDNDVCFIELSISPNNQPIKINSKPASLISSGSVSLNESKDSNCLEDDNAVFLDAEDGSEYKEFVRDQNCTEKMCHKEELVGVVNEEKREKKEELVGLVDEKKKKKKLFGQVEEEKTEKKEELVGLIDIKNTENKKDSISITINNDFLHSTDNLPSSQHDSVNLPNDNKSAVDNTIDSHNGGKDPLIDIKSVVNNKVDSHNDKNDELSKDQDEVIKACPQSSQDNKQELKVEENNFIKAQVRCPKPLPRTKSNSNKINTLMTVELKDNTQDTNEKPTINIFNVKPCFDVIKESIGILDALSVGDDFLSKDSSRLYESINDDDVMLGSDTSQKYDLPPKNDLDSKQEDMGSNVEDNIYERIDGDDDDDDENEVIKDLNKRITETEETLERLNAQKHQLIHGIHHENRNINDPSTDDIEFVQANIDGLTQELVFMRGSLKTLLMRSSKDIKINYREQTDNIYENDQNIIKSIKKHKTAPKKNKRNSRENKLKNNFNEELSVKERKKKRMNLIEEILMTEKEHLNCLQACQQSYSNDESAPKEIFEVFKDLSLVINCSKNFLNKLDDFVFGKAFEDQLIGKCFKDCNDDMKSSYSAYCTSFEDRIAHLNNLEKNPAIKTWMQSRLEALKSHLNVFDLPSILIKPLQRILKYPLFIGQLIKCTSIDHKDLEHLLAADECLKHTNMHINELKRRRELVRRYKKSDESWFWSKFNMHSLKKKVNRLLTPGVHLEHFGVFEKDFRDLFLFTKDLSLRLHLYLLALKTSLKQEENLIGEMAAFVEDQDNDFKLLTSLQSSICYQFFPQLESKVREGVLAWLKDLQASFLAPRLLMRKRHHKLKDLVCAEMAYKSALSDLNSDISPSRPSIARDFMMTRSMSLRRGSSRSSVSKGSSMDEINQPSVATDQLKLKKDLERSKQDYEALNDQLCEELPTLFEASYDVLGYCIYHFNMALRDFFSAIQRHFRDVFKDSQVFKVNKKETSANIISNFDKVYQPMLQNNLQLSAVSFSFTNPSSNTRKMSSFFVDYLDNTPVKKPLVKSKRPSSSQDNKSMNLTSKQSPQKSMTNKPPVLPPRPSIPNKPTK